MARPAYVGMGGENRPYAHAKLAKTKKGHRNSLLQATFEKSWKLGFDTLPVVIFARDLSWADAIFLEQETIARYGRIVNHTGCLTNLTDGGEGVVGAVRSAETCARISAAKKGQKLSEETRRKMSVARKGRKFSEEARRRMSEAQKGRLITEEHRKNIIAAARRRPPPSAAARKAWGDSHRGIPRPPHVIEAVRAAHLGAKRSDETRAKIRAKALGRKVSEETRKKMSASHLLRYSAIGQV